MIKRLILGVLIVLFLFTSSLIIFEQYTKYEIAASSGCSMTPTVSCGHEIIILDTEGDTEKSDIIAYHNNKRNIDVMHRLIYKNQSHFISKGDNNTVVDGVYRNKYIYGKVVKIVELPL